MLRKIGYALALLVMSTAATPREATAHRQFGVAASPRSTELRADVDPRGWWIGPEI